MNLLLTNNARKMNTPILSECAKVFIGHVTEGSRLQIGNEILVVEKLLSDRFEGTIRTSKGYEIPNCSLRYEMLDNPHYNENIYLLED